MTARPAALPFVKGHGTGNDFVLIPDPDGALDLTADQVAALCDRRFGIGADGDPARRALDAHARGGARRPPTPSGSWTTATPTDRSAEMCGNGIRVFVRYLIEIGLGDAVDEPLPIGTRPASRP